MLDPIMLADNNKLFHSHKDFNALFLKVNSELHKINQWFISSRLSPNIKEAKYSFFHKRSKKDDFLFFLSNYEFKRVETIKFLGVVLDKNVHNL